MRRLPIYFLVDVSESMVGTPIEQVQDGMTNFINELRKDPYSLESCFVSVITYNSGVNSLSPLTPIFENCLPKISIGTKQEESNESNLDNALGTLANIIDKNVEKSIVNKKGDWKPIVYIMTNGKSNCEWSNGLAEYKSLQLGQSIVCLTCNVIKHQTMEKLSNVTDCIVSLNDKGTKILMDALKSLYCNDVVVGGTDAWKRILSPFRYVCIDPHFPNDSVNDELPPPPTEEIEVII